MKKEAELKKKIKNSINRKTTMTVSDMSEIMWHILRSVNTFFNYIYPMNKKIYF